MIYTKHITHSTKIQDKILIFFILLSFIDYGAYGYYCLLPGILYLTFKTTANYRFFIDNKLLSLLFFGIFYSIGFLFNNEFRYNPVLLTTINFPFLYLCGKYIGLKNTQQNLIKILWLFALGIGLISLLSIYLDIQKNGFFSIDRNIPLIGIQSEYIAATGISARLVLLNAFFCVIFSPKRIKYHWIYFTISIFSLIGCLRLQSRTSFVIIAILLIYMIIKNWKTYKTTHKLIIISIILLLIYITIWAFTQSDNLAIIDRFSGEDTESGGGRLDLLSYYISKIPSYPFGGIPQVVGHNVFYSSPYAHNFWIDIFRLSGWIPGILMIIFSIRFIKELFHFNKRKFDKQIKYVTTLLSITLLIQFCGEPILEGIYMLFAYFCLLFGIINALNSIK